MVNTRVDRFHEPKAAIPPTVSTRYLEGIREDIQMASNNLNIKIDLSDDAYEILKATKVIHCLNTQCKFNSVGKSFLAQHAECCLKRIYILKDGTCEQFEKVGKDEN